MSRLFLVLWLLALISGLHSEPHDDPESHKITLDEVPVVAEDISYESPLAKPGKFYFAEHFDDVVQFHKKWIKSEAKKDGADEDIAKYDGVWSLEAPQKVLLKNDLGLVLKSKAKHAAISARLDKPFVFSDKPLVVQFEVTLQDGQECGGSYIKLLSSGKDTTDLRAFHDRTPYSIMFGPDKCGNDYKYHFIFRHTNPLNGTVEEKHCKKPRERIEEPFRDKLPHLYRLTLWPDNTFAVYLDKRIVNEGSLLQDFTPAVNPPSEIPDPSDAKPADWDDREKIPDPDAAKPEDWDEDEPPQIPDKSAVKPDGWLDDEEEMISDAKAVKPEDWDADMDGEWEAPLIPNPACEGVVGCGQWKAPFINNPNYKGKWRAPYITNPNYKGKWSPRMIANPGYFQDLEPFKMAPIAAVGIEIWSMSQDILFDNIIITDNYEEADQWAALTFDLKQKQIDITAESLFGRLLKYTNDNPWLWAVYTVAIALPLAIMLFFCCSSSNKDKEEQNRINAKKTDAVSPDDQPEEKTQYESIAKVEKKVDEGKQDSEELESPDMDEEEEKEIEDEDEAESAPEPEAVGEENTARKRKPRRE